MFVNLPGETFVMSSFALAAFFMIALPPALRRFSDVVRTSVLLVDPQQSFRYKGNGRLDVMLRFPPDVQDKFEVRVRELREKRKMINGLAQTRHEEALAAAEAALKDTMTRADVAYEQELRALFTEFYVLQVPAEAAATGA